MWSRKLYASTFPGGPTDKPVSAFDSTLCSERYANRVSEIWYSAKEAMRSGQIKGLGADVIRELTTRKKQDEKGLQLRIRIESKLEMKNHTDKSPDIADAAMGLCELCCERLGFSSAVAIRRAIPAATRKPFKKLFQGKDICSRGRISRRCRTAYSCERTAHVLIAPIDYISRVASGSLSIVAHFLDRNPLRGKDRVRGRSVVLTSNIYKFCTAFPARYCMTQGNRMKRSARRSRNPEQPSPGRTVILATSFQEHLTDLAP
jgi:hypothetical protein